MDTALLDLPGYVVTDLCTVLDSSAEHNWRKLVEQVPNYTHLDVMELHNIAQQGSSATRELLRNLNGQGWTLQELVSAVRQAGIFSILDILSAYFEEEGIEVDLSHDHTPSTNWLGARSCFHRSPYSTELAPPTNSMNEACRRYQIPHPPVDSVMSETNLGCSDTTEKQSFPNGFANTSASSPSRKKIPCQDTPTFSPFEAPPTPAGLEEVKYEVLLDATGQFDRAPYKEGGHKIGEGGFGEVFQCSLVLKSGPVHAAVKVFLNQSDVGNSGTSVGSVDSVDRQQFSAETQSLSKLSHKCLLPVLAYSCNGPRLCLVYPFMSNGSLEAHLPDLATLPTTARLHVACDVASALHYLHTMPEGAVVHRDVKSANILLSDKWRGRLGDFGLARTLPSSSSILTTTVVGTPLYMAPETIGGTITQEADMYAFGMVLYELLTGRCALAQIETESGEETDLLSYIEEHDGDQQDLLLGQWEDHIHTTLWRIADQCILKNRRRRPTSSQVFKELEPLCSQTDYSELPLIRPPLGPVVS